MSFVLCPECKKRSANGIRGYDNKEMCVPCITNGDHFDMKGKLNDKRRKDL